MDHPEGADKPGDIRLGFDRRVRLVFHGSKDSSDGELLLFRELDEVLYAEGHFYAIRLRPNPILQRKVAHLLKRPVGRPHNYVRRLYGDFEYQAASWNTPLRIVAKVEWHPAELVPRVDYVVTNLPMEPYCIIRFYNQSDPRLRVSPVAGTSNRSQLLHLIPEPRTGVAKRLNQCADRPRHGIYRSIHI